MFEQQSNSAKGVCATVGTYISQGEAGDDGKRLYETAPDGNCASAPAKQKRVSRPQKKQANPHPTLLEMVQAAQGAVKLAGRTDPAKVGAAFKRIHGKTFDEARIAHELPSKTKLKQYIILPELKPVVETSNTTQQQALVVQQKTKKKNESAPGAPEVHRCDLCEIDCSGLKQLQEHQAGKKHKKKVQTGVKKAQQTSKPFAGGGKASPSVPWTDAADIPADLVEALQAVASEQEPLKQARANSEPWNCIPRESESGSHLRGCLMKNEIVAKTRTYLMNQIQVGTAERNKEKLYKDNELQESLRQRVGDEPSLLASVAEELNLTTTDLGFVLSGRTIMDRVIDKSIDPAFVEESGKVIWRQQADPVDYKRRTAIARETVRLSPTDGRTGRKCESRNLGVAAEAAGHQVRWNNAGAKGESILKRDLREAGIVGFSTEVEDVQQEFDDQSATGKVATPDVLFKTAQMICGHEVNWIDAKNAVHIPGVSPESMLKQWHEQSEKYVERFGPGAILWTKCGFCEAVAKANDKVAHFRPDCQKQKRKQKGGDMSQTKTKEKEHTVGARRTQICEHWRRGRCSHGRHCHFAHGEGQQGTLRTMPQQDFAHQTALRHHAFYIHQQPEQTTGGKTLDLEAMREQRLLRFAQQEEPRAEEAASENATDVGAGSRR